MTAKRQIVTVGIMGATAVALGAFGAHGLKSKMAEGLITPDQLNGFDTAVRYQMYHVLAILGVVMLKQHFNNKYLNTAYYFFVAGIYLFSGSLYLLTTRNLTGGEFLSILGPVTPVGGLCFVTGWLLMMGAAINKNK